MTNLAISELQTTLMYSFLVFLRVGTAIAMSPGLGENYLSPRIKLITGLTVSFAIAPVVREFITFEEMHRIEYAIFATRELIVGLFFGLFARGVIFLLEKAGAIISQMASLAQLLPLDSISMPTFGHILVVTGLALYFYTPLHNYAITIFFESYSFAMPTEAEARAYFAELSASLLDFVFRHGFILSIGFVIIWTVFYLFVGFANKTFPQFMVSFVGIPFVALFSVFFCSSIMRSY